jgi:type IV secretory pathway VirB2 component (pilin)
MKIFMRLVLNMQYKYIYSFAVVVGTVFFVCSGLVFASGAPDSGGYALLEPSILVHTGGTSASPSQYLENIFYFMIGTAGVLAVLMIAIGGIEYMFAGANPGKMKDAQEKIWAAIFGVVLAVGAWLILNTINPDLTDFNLTLSTVTVDGNGGVGGGGGATSTPGTLPSNLPTGCRHYESAFRQAASATGMNVCLLQAVASAESSCNPSAQSSVGACGIMQMKPSTANATCDWLKANPEASILSAAYYLKNNASGLNRYASTFDIGNNDTQSGQTVTIGGFTYDRGNDDLIASYNAGNGTVSTNGRGPFSVSQDCPASQYGGTAIPAWQCHINPGGFDETQNYVRRVQTFQDMCDL